MICAHAPTEEKDENEKDQLHKNLNNLYDELPPNDIKIIAGDFKANICRTAQAPHSLHSNDINDIENRVIDLAQL